MTELSCRTVPVDFNDGEEGGKERAMRMRGDPTVTINTKEALKDVFGMYNSPEKTIKVARAGSKHAPVRKVEPIGAPSVGGSAGRQQSPGDGVKTPGMFKLFV